MKKLGSRMSNPRSLNLEQLDARVCLSVEATFDAGVLQIQGTDNADRITIQDMGDGSVRVQDLVGKHRWSFADVRSIQVETQAGDDHVRFERHQGPSPLPKLGFDLGAGNDSLGLRSGVGDPGAAAAQLDLDIKAGEGDDDVAIGLLVPAVQKVREAAARMNIDLGAGDDHLGVRTHGLDRIDMLVNAGEGEDAVLIGLLVPAVQKVNDTADPGSLTDPPVNLDIQAGDGNDDVQVGLLLPAVQKVREAAARMSIDLGAGDDRANVQTNGIGQVGLGLTAGDGDDAILIGLLLPAVQKVREAAARMSIDLGAGDDRANVQTNGIGQVGLGLTAGDGDDAALIGLLLPAVQKVREAAARADVRVDLGAGNDRLQLQTLGAEQVDAVLAAGDGDDDVSVALLLPAVQKVREAAARVQVDLGAGQDQLRLKIRGYDQVDKQIVSDRLDSIDEQVALAQN